MDHIENAKEEIADSALYGGEPILHILIFIIFWLLMIIHSDRIRFMTINHQWLNVSMDDYDPNIKISWTTADNSAKLKVEKLKSNYLNFIIIITASTSSTKY